MHLYQFDNAEQLDKQLVEKIKTILTQAITERGRAYFAVSGGKTPVNLFQKLAATTLDWEKVTIILTDERWISPSESDSNEHLVKTYLLKEKAERATFISLYSAMNEDSDETKTRIATLPAFDVVILGMGEDGHTASLFPCSAEIPACLADDSFSVVTVHPTKAPYRRISLSKARLLNSRTIFLHLVGKKKMEVLNKAIAGTNPLEMPVRAFLHHPSANVQIMYSP
ncbi:6-phosphogluconolactonase [Legionella jamestowniensis]|uniref:6-phosphogluconolactonase n=1 Tax=Legionella jamestowniensis TaxID=455 RepID=A0A0W0UP30_9GAMM|nr:6-phosphogluconolactonase [Legionella jamestowniensis]KTD09382.1 6-phosphogluconolactonase [Legionella jamestowniensis]OCH99209.1 6-phosphogluconolactonase [Legionella jamestowniensis]SFL88417.1 6-phosphogluconolactonase [Legionella jamestowniensis DSM 19215]